MKSLQYLWSANQDPFHNLAIEDALLDRGDPVLFLYVNGPCVVIGKHQNPWRECDLEAMAADGVPLVRRVSGGGAVYNDEQNLNIAVFTERTSYRREAVAGLFIEVLAEFGVAAMVEGSSSLVADGRKISGQAFCYRRDTVLHHGTLLLDTDLERMDRYLRRSTGFETHAVESVPAKVANLGLAIPELVAAFKGRSAGEIDMPEIESAQLERFESWEWTHGKTPRFKHGEEEIVHGRVTVSTDAKRVGQRFSVRPGR